MKQDETRETRYCPKSEVSRKRLSVSPSYGCDGDENAGDEWRDRAEEAGTGYPSRFVMAEVRWTDKSWQRKCRQNRAKVGEQAPGRDL